MQMQKEIERRQRHFT